MISWHYTGQPPEEWPLWLQFTNYGWDRESKRLVIPQLETRHQVMPGEWIDRRPDGLLSIRKEDP